MSKQTKSAPPQEERYVAPGANGEPRENSLERRLALFEVETPRRQLSDLIVPEATRRQIASLLTKIRHAEVLYQDFGLGEIDPQGKRTAINLYGPPGTGKSFAAEAIAHELAMGLIRANYAQIESKFVGETPKNIKAAFQKARECEAVLFFDEADSILGKRLANVSQSTDHAVNVSRSVMLLELDRFSGVTIFATNLASNYDGAFVRRILGHIEMPLPDARARRQLWDYHLPARLPAELSIGDREQLVQETEGLSGGDILNIVVYAASMALEQRGPQCRIGLDDFRTAIEAIKLAHQEIGA